MWNLTRVIQKWSSSKSKWYGILVNTQCPPQHLYSSMHIEICVMCSHTINIAIDVLNIAQITQHSRDSLSRNINVFNCVTLFHGHTKGAIDPIYSPQFFSILVAQLFWILSLEKWLLFMVKSWHRTKVFREFSVYELFRWFEIWRERLQRIRARQVFQILDVTIKIAGMATLLISILF